MAVIIMVGDSFERWADAGLSGYVPSCAER